MYDFFSFSCLSLVISSYYLHIIVISELLNEIHSKQKTSDKTINMILRNPFTEKNNE